MGLSGILFYMRNIFLPTWSTAWSSAVNSVIDAMSRLPSLTPEPPSEGSSETGSKALFSPSEAGSEVSFAPVYNITVPGGDADGVRQAVMDTAPQLFDLFQEFMRQYTAERGRSNFGMTTPDFAVG